jgi:hypothetical protein
VTTMVINLLDSEVPDCLAHDTPVSSIAVVLITYTTAVTGL